MNIKQIGEAMFSAKHRIMTEDESKVMIILIGDELQGSEVPSVFTESFHFQVIKKRLEVFKSGIANDYVIAMFSVVCDRVGVAVLYAAALAAIYLKTGKQVTMQTTFEDFFGDGFPTQEELERIWIMQRVNGGGNSVDRKAAWEATADA